MKELEFEISILRNGLTLGSIIKQDDKYVFIPNNLYLIEDELYRIKNLISIITSA